MAITNTGNSFTPKNNTGTKEEGSPKFKVDFSGLYTEIVLNWKWFVLSILICLGLAWLYMRYTTPVYESSAKMLIKDNDGNSGRNNSSMSLSNVASGTVSVSNGIDNELEILTTHSLAAQVIRDLKLYVEYYSMGKMKEILIYKNQPITVDMDPMHLEKLKGQINFILERTDNGYHISGNNIEKDFNYLPQTISTKYGRLTFKANSPSPMSKGQKIRVIITSPINASYKYVARLSAKPTGRTTSIIRMTLDDVDQQRASDFLQQLAICYNQQANDEKNEVAIRTEEFINGRIQKLNAELGNTEGQIENYKKRQGMVELKVNATNAFTQANETEKMINDANTQLALLQEMRSVVTNPHNKYQLLPVNIGINNEAVTSLVNDYNSIVQKRTLLLQSASEASPTVIPLTNQLDQLQNGISHAVAQAIRSTNIQRNSLISQFGKYNGEVGATPEQERTLTQIGRQQEVKSGLYIMLLQKREENSISLAATADKGRIIDGPTPGGMVSPNKQYVLLATILAGIGIPAIILFILQLFHYKIEGHDDVVKLTSLPILADVAVASKNAKDKGEIVVRENKNDIMEEIFRSMRTNILFMLGEKQKVILCTSNTTGEGKSFISSNLAMSFALLGKKVVLVGLDIRKPRLHHIFDIGGNRHGLTSLLTLDNPTWEDIEGIIKPSGKNDNLFIVPSGPIPPNPAEIVARPSLETIFNELRKHFDYVIVDSAPAGMVTDTLAIGRVCDTTMFVCRADYTPKASFGFVNQLADEKKLPKISIVINGIDMSKKKYGYYYGYGRYGKYGRYGRYGKSYGYGSYGAYGTYGHTYGNKDDNSVKK